MIKFSKEDGMIKPTGIRKLDGKHDMNLSLPHIAIGVFSECLLNDIVQKFLCEKVGTLSCANCQRPVYIMKYKDVEFTLFMAGISGPWISSDIEQLSVHGVDTFIIFGNCGVLDKSIEDCSIIIPNKAFRDEGTSYHYMTESDWVELNPKYTDVFKQILKENNYEFFEGATWTTDGFFRETREKVKYFKEQGAVCVEMEGACIAAVCKYRNLDYFTFYYAGDNMDAIEWDERSLNQLTNFEKKKLVPYLAFELARKISDIRGC